MNEEGTTPKDYEFIDTAEHLNEWVGKMRAWLAESADKRCCLDTEACLLYTSRCV